MRLSQLPTKAHHCPPKHTKKQTSYVGIIKRPQLVRSNSIKAFQLILFSVLCSLSLKTFADFTLRTMPPHSVGVKCPKGGQGHAQIQGQFPQSICCPYCACRWPEPLEINDSEEEVTPTRTTSQSSSSQVFGPLALSNQQLIRPVRDRTTNFKNNFKSKAQEAVEACRPIKKANPYAHPAGLYIRLMCILTMGEYRHSFFLSGKTTKLGAYDTIRVFRILIMSRYCGSTTPDK